MTNVPAWTSLTSKDAKEIIFSIIANMVTVVHSTVFTGHLVYACILVTLIFHNDNSLIMRQELTLLIKKSWSLLLKHMRKHNPTLFVECLATENVETYKHLAGISKEQEKQCLQKWQQNSDFSRFLKIIISKLCQDFNNFFAD